MIMIFFLNFILIYKLNVQIQISVMIGNLYSVDLITGFSGTKNWVKEKINEMTNKKIQ